MREKSSAAIASSSIITELVKGKTIKEALKLPQDNVVFRILQDYK